MSWDAEKGVLTIVPDFSGFRLLVQAYADRLAAATDEACMRMLFGNAGALHGVLVETLGSWFRVSLIDPDDDPRVTAGEITEIRHTPTSYSWARRAL